MFCHQIDAQFRAAEPIARQMSDEFRSAVALPVDPLLRAMLAETRAEIGVATDRFVGFIGKIFARTQRATLLWRRQPTNNSERIARQK